MRIVFLGRISDRINLRSGSKFIDSESVPVSGDEDRVKDSCQDGR